MKPPSVSGRPPGSLQGGWPSALCSSLTGSRRAETACCPFSFWPGLRPRPQSPACSLCVWKEHVQGPPGRESVWSPPRVLWASLPTTACVRCPVKPVASHAQCCLHAGMATSGLEAHGQGQYQSRGFLAKSLFSHPSRCLASQLVLPSRTSRRAQRGSGQPQRQFSVLVGFAAQG